MERFFFSFIFLFLLPGTIYSSEPTIKNTDYVLMFHDEDCKIIGSPTILGSKPPIIVLDGKGSGFSAFCEKKGAHAICDFLGPDMKVFASRTLIIFKDNPPELGLATDSGSDYFLINTTRKSAVSAARIITEESDKPASLGMKICNGVFLTKQQFDKWVSK